MNQYIFLIRMPSALLTKDHLQRLGIKWQWVIQDWAKQGRFVTAYRFNQSGYRLAERSIKKGYYKDYNEVVSGCMIVLAETIEEAVALSQNCPTLEAGGSIEVRLLH